MNTMTRWRAATIAAVLTAASAGLAGRAAAAQTAAAVGQRATARLDEARLALVRVSERSMPQEAREVLGDLRQEFHALYRSYTGRDMDRIASPSAETGADRTVVFPRGVWKNFYAEVQRTLDGLIGAEAAARPPDARAPSMPSTAADKGIAGLPQPARRDFTEMRRALQQFHQAAVAIAPPFS